MVKELNVRRGVVYRTYHEIPNKESRLSESTSDGPIREELVNGLQEKLVTLAAVW